MRTIDADTLLEKVEKIQPWDAYLGKYAQGIRHCMELVSLLIQDAPTIEPEPCEDAISRKDAIDALEQKPHYYDGKDCVEQNYDDRMTIMKLPSVTPKQRTGKWIYYPKASGSVTSTAVHLYPVCSECGCEHPVANYCPNCGARMEGGES